MAGHKNFNELRDTLKTNPDYEQKFEAAMQQVSHLGTTDVPHVFTSPLEFFTDLFLASHEVTNNIALAALWNNGMIAEDEFNQCVLCGSVHVVWLETYSSWYCVKEGVFL
jgi:hypothetical protein